MNCLGWDCVLSLRRCEYAEETAEDRQVILHRMEIDRICPKNTMGTCFSSKGAVVIHTLKAHVTPSTCFLL